MVSSPKIPTPQAAPPPPTPAQLTMPKPGAQGKATLGGTYLTASMPNAAPITKPKKTLLGQ